VSVSTSKKIVIRRFDREPLLGFVNPQTGFQLSGLEFLTPSGAIATAPYEDIKAIVFVRDFDVSEPSQKLFHTRPKMNGLWVRMKFRDGEVMDGLLSSNLLQVEPYGFTLVPPNPTSNNQKMFVPRAALAEVQVLGVVGSPLRERKPKAKPKDQLEMFE
jgi:hypothetical protein